MLFRYVINEIEIFHRCQILSVDIYKAYKYMKAYVIRIYIETDTEFIMYIGHIPIVIVSRNTNIFIRKK